MRILNLGEVDSIPRDHFPKHIALIIDGNRRWAAGRGIPAERAHDRTSDAIGRTILEAHRLKIPHVTFYSMSTQNANRASDELIELFSLDRWLWPHALISILIGTKSRVSLIGNIADLRYRREVFEPIASLPEVSSPQIHVTFAVNYGGREELQLASGKAANGAPLGAGLYDPATPDVDLLIRTSGEQRLSNFMLWQCAYAELVFMDTLWPDFTGLHLDSAIAQYASRDRRLGI